MGSDVEDETTGTFMSPEEWTATLDARRTLLRRLGLIQFYEMTVEQTDAAVREEHRRAGNR
jgi:hypothetical protein